MTALQALTEDVVNSGRLLRVRTNEASTGQPWVFTEFVIHSTTKMLVRTTVKQAPTMALAGGTSTLLGQWIRDNELNLRALEHRNPAQTYSQALGTYVVPDKFPATSTWFRGGHNETDGSGDLWNAPNPGLDSFTWSDARHRFSLGTCRGCHGTETDTPMLHIQGRLYGSVATLSPFLQGATPAIVDPVDPSISRTFNEMKRREDDLKWLVGGNAVGTAVFGNGLQLRRVAGSPRSS